jgi:hypothetical protein
MSQPPQPDSPGSEPDARPAPVTRGRHHRLELVIWGAHGGAGTTTLATVRFQLLAARVVRVPFVAGRRLADDPATVPLPRPVLRALAQIQAAAGRPSPLR